MIRKCFVSNSSSSSFVCCLTGEADSAMDASPSDLGMTECANGHIFYNRFLLEGEDPTLQDKRDWLKSQSEKYDWYKQYYTESLEMEDEAFEEWFEEEWDYSFNEEGISTKRCPVCQFVDLPDEDISKYFQAQLGKSRKDIALFLKEQFGTYDKFQEFIKQGEKK
jgi:hypothetical protein